MPPAQTKQVIESELNAKLEQVFQWIDLEKPLGSASISQVSHVPCHKTGHLLNDGGPMQLAPSTIHAVGQYTLATRQHAVLQSSATDTSISMLCLPNHVMY